MPSVDYRSLDLAPDPSSVLDLSSRDMPSYSPATIASDPSVLVSLVHQTSAMGALSIATVLGDASNLTVGRYPYGTWTLAPDRSSVADVLGLHRYVIVRNMGSSMIAGIPIEGQLWPRGYPRMY